MEFENRINEALFRHLIKDSAIPMIGSAVAVYWLPACSTGDGLA